ncbi:hypothetical protein K435DRAFT_849153 [Dendrothele bispora CBS 962.96]|uniref:Uncharacterized protein n=1 Tax=Dendrothele bispora (strain CBS 962.96) TaxID=1314807 RepID=A0A4S8MT57_DENBC|nr:hypothetical protein K435DRAFT_849153 [Dendrothele bispora CBS 962.96]
MSTKLKNDPEERCRIPTPTISTSLTSLKKSRTVLVTVCGSVVVADEEDDISVDVGSELMEGKEDLVERMEMRESMASMDETLVNVAMSPACQALIMD